MKNRVLLDTNFLMIPCKDKIDIFTEIERLMTKSGQYEIATLQGVKEELARIAERSRGVNRIAAQVGLQLLETKKIKVLESGPGTGVDEAILKLAENDRKMIVCTNDKALKTALQRLGIMVVSMRNMNHLEFV